MENTLLVTAYTIYLPLTIVLTLFVARKLFGNGKIFMLEIFRGDEKIATATNRLFEIGFYLLNIGFAMLIMRIRTTAYRPFETNRELMEILGIKIGGFAIYLGVTLFAILFLMLRGRKNVRGSDENRETELIDNIITGEVKLTEDGRGEE